MNFQSPRRIKRGWMNLKITKITEETPDTKTFYFEDADDGGRPYDFIAGQYLTFRYDTISPKPLVRSYTMSGSPCQLDHSIVTVKRIPGGLVSNWMCDQLKVGDILRARGPIGRFVYESNKDSKHLLMLAAGSGVTPFTSIIREYAPHLGKEDNPDSLHLLVAYRTKVDLINWDDLKQAAKLPNVRIICTLTREDAVNEGFWHGRPDEAMIKKFVDGFYHQGTFFSCGPQEMMDLFSQHLRNAGVREDRIKNESFDS